MKGITTFSVVSSLLACLASAQYTIDPNSVANSTRETWCASQQAQCPLICLQTAAESSETNANRCDPATLTYACICSNGLSPNITEFSQTLPYFICTEWGTQCVSNCDGNTACQSACLQDHPCGAQNPTRANTTSSSTTSGTASITGTSSVNSAVITDSNGATINTGYGGASATSTPNGVEPGSIAAQTSGNGAASIKTAALSVGQVFGVMGVMAVLFGSFAVFL